MNSYIDPNEILVSLKNNQKNVLADDKNKYDMLIENLEVSLAINSKRHIEVVIQQLISENIPLLEKYKIKYIK